MARKNPTASGPYYWVRMSKSEVRTFKKSWPNSGLPDSYLGLQLNRHGDLVSTDPKGVFGSTATDQSALAHLVTDARELLLKKGKILQGDVQAGVERSGASRLGPCEDCGSLDGVGQALYRLDSGGGPMHLCRACAKATDKPERSGNPRALPVFLVPADEDQPFQCPHCSARTTWTGADPFRAVHTCRGCLQKMRFEVDDGCDPEVVGLTTGCEDPSLDIEGPGGVTPRDRLGNPQAGFPYQAPVGGFIIWLKDRNRIETDAAGRIIFDGTRKMTFEPSDSWKITGIGTRAQSQSLISLDAAADGADIGQGWIHDLDHGTRRMWGSPPTHRAVKVERVTGGRATNPSKYPRVMAAFRKAGMKPRLIDTGGGCLNIAANAFGYEIIAYGGDKVDGEFPENDKEPFWRHGWEVALMSPHHGDALQTWSTPNIENMDVALQEAFVEARRKYTAGETCAAGCVECVRGLRPGRAGNPACEKCDCADPTALPGLAADCPCQCHRAGNPGAVGTPMSPRPKVGALVVGPKSGTIRKVLGPSHYEGARFQSGEWSVLLDGLDRVVYVDSNEDGTWVSGGEDFQDNDPYRSR